MEKKYQIVISIPILVLLFLFLFYLANNIKFLNENSGALTVVFSAVVALSTMVYAILTWKLVTVNEKMMELQIEPNISVFLQPKEGDIYFVEMVIKNIGNGPAYNITFNVDPDFEYGENKYLSEKGCFQKLNYLPPGKEFKFFLTSLLEDTERKLNTKFDVKVKYYDKFDRPASEIFTIDFSEFDGLTQVGEPPLKEIANNTSNISKNIKKISSGTKRIKTEIFTQEDVEREKKERRKRYEELKKQNEQKNNK